MNAFTHSVTAAYTGRDASIEILIMLLVAALIGYAIHWLLCKMRGCCGTPWNRPAWLNWGGAGTTKAVVAAGAGAVTAQATHTAHAMHANAVTHDDLEVIEGIGPKVAKALNAAQIFSFAQVADMAPEALRKVLDAAGDQFKMLPTDTWPKQAAMARDGKTVELEAYKKHLDNGREPGTH